MSSQVLPPWMLTPEAGGTGGGNLLVIPAVHCAVALWDTDYSNKVTIEFGDHTSDASLTIEMGDNARVITLQGDPTLADWFDQSVKTTASPTFSTATLSSISSNYYPWKNGSGSLADGFLHHPSSNVIAVGEQGNEHTTLIWGNTDIRVGTPTSTGSAVLRVIGGSSGSPDSAHGEGIISVLYSAQSDAGSSHAAVNAQLYVDSTADFYPWAISSIVSTESSKGEAVAFWGRAEGSAGAPLWGVAIEVTDKIGAVSSAANMIGVEVAMFPESGTSGVVRGLDVIAKGSYASDTGIVIRDGVSTWDQGLYTEITGDPITIRESGSTLPAGLWRVAADADRLRFDMNTDVNGLFATYRALVTLDTDGTLYLGGHPSIGAVTETLIVKKDSDSINVKDRIGVDQSSPSGAVHISNNADQWCSSNYGTNLIIKDGSVARNPAIGIFDSSDSNPWAIANESGKLVCGTMPALGNTATDVSRHLILTSAGNIGIGTTTPGGGTTTGTKSLSIQNGTAPVGGVSNQSTFYAADVSSSSEMFVLDEAGNTTQLSPHDPLTGEWIFYSKNVHTGKVKKVRMERLVTLVEKLTGEKLLEEWIDGDDSD